MTPEELKQFGELAKKYEDKDKDQVLKIIKDDIHPVFQDINDGGRTAANKANEKKVKELETARDEAQTKMEKAEADLAELNGKAPDAAKLREKYEKDLKDAREDFGKKELALKNQLKDATKETQVEKLVDILERDYGVDRDYAQEVLVRKSEHAERIQIGDDRKLTVLKKGTTDIPLVPPSDGKKTLLHLLADDMVVGLDPKWKTSKVNRGSSTQGSGGGSGPTEGNEFKNLRKEVQEREKKATKAKAETPSGYERLRSGRR